MKQKFCEINPSVVLPSWWLARVCRASLFGVPHLSSHRAHIMALFHCMVRHGTVRYGSLLGGFPLGTVPGTWYFFSTTSAEVPSDPYHYQNVTCKLCWSLIGRRKSSLLPQWTCDMRSIDPLDLNQHSQRRSRRCVGTPIWLKITSGDKLVEYSLDGFFVVVVVVVVIVFFKTGYWVEGLNSLSRLNWRSPAYITREKTGRLAFL